MRKGCKCPKGARRIKGGACLRKGKFVKKVGAGCKR